MTKLFFSGTLSENSPLKDFCAANNWQLTARSLLRFEAIPFTLTASFEVVFFSSPRSINYFISQFKVPDGVQLACIGKGTAAELAKRHISPAFVGENSGDPEAVALEFTKWLGDRHVLFPLAKQSNETIARMIPAAQKTIVRCYETHPIRQEFAPQDVYVFTSPSSVEAFLSVNRILNSDSIISWGKTTDKKIVELGFKSITVLAESSEEALVEVLTGML